MNKEFNNYVKQFDIKNHNIMDKFHHSYRVMEYAKEIGKHLNLKEKDMNLLMMCSLLHDIARFKQVTEYNTFDDLKSFDHGDIGCQILKENKFIEKFTKNKEEQDIILFSVKNHNKKEIIDGTKKEVMFSKIVRDADKIDIMIEQGNILTKDNLIINEALLEEINDNKLCSNINVKNEADSIIRMLSFIYDINYHKSFEIILENKIIENKIELLKIYTVNKDLEKLKEKLLNYVKER